MLFCPHGFPLQCNRFSPAVARYAQKCIGKRQSLSKEYHTVRFLSIRKHEVCAYQRPFPKENPRALLYGWKDTGELAVMWLYRMASLSALPGLKVGTLQAG